jgi:hypothetical protein
MALVDNILMGRHFPAAPGPPPSPQVTEQYMQWLVVANFIRMKHNKPETTRKKISIFDRFCSFMQHQGRSAFAATPQDVAIYLTIWSFTSGRYCSGPWRLVAPTSAQGLISHLAAEYDHFPWTAGDWDAAKGRGTPPSLLGYLHVAPGYPTFYLFPFLNFSSFARAGNPVRSLAVHEWYLGYRRHLVELGYRPQSAVPWAEQDLATVLADLDLRSASATGVLLLKLKRDAFTLTVLWETCSRGATAVCWRLKDLYLPSGTLAVPHSAAPRPLTRLHPHAP